MLQLALGPGVTRGWHYQQRDNCGQRRNISFWVVSKLREAKSNGWTILLHTARGMGRSNGKIELVQEEVINEITSFCSKWDVPYDEIIVGKPWAAMYVDDKALRPDEFANLDLNNWSPRL